MNVGQVILGRPWFDKNITIYGRSNMCQFEHEGKHIKLLPLRSKTEHSKQTFTLALLLTPLSPPLIATFPFHLSLIMHILFANRFLSYCWHHLIIEHSGLHLHHTNTCTNYTN